MAFALAGCSDPDPAPQAYAWEVSDSALEDRAWDIAGMLPVEPGSYVPPVSDRSAWEAYGRQSPQLLAKAKTFLNQPVPALPDDLYLTFTTKGTRKGYERPYSARIERLGTFAAAEAVANNGQFITAIERELQAILDEKTWVMPAHDRDLKNFNGEVVDVDLGASRRGLAVAGVLTLLGDKLSTELTEQAHAELKRRVFEPYLKRLTGQDDSLCRWVKWDNNWNAVCHSGVVAAALFTLPSEDTRGLIVAGAEASLPRYFKSFRSDGFCTEGLSYWNYGFGHYVTLAETFWRLSEGEIDLYESPLVRKIATYPARLEMAPRQFPSFGDSPRNPQPEAWILDVCASHLPLSGDVKQEPYPAIPLFLEQCFRVSFSPSRPLSLAAMREDQLRSWFPEAQVYVGRMPGDSSEQMAIAVKGGRNGENHGHNDLGQFIIANRGRQVITDPGGEAYTAATFGPKRYESPMLNSIGHPVPVIAGQLQGSERTA
ncbi:MAG: heparinase II/III domain-containing protein, partial [Puniceicoccales bacterium]